MYANYAKAMIRPMMGIALVPSAYLFFQHQTVNCSADEELRVRDRVLTVDKMMFGGSGIAGMYVVISRETAISALQKAVDLGIKAFDTAPWYGAGFSEDYFGEVLGKLKDVEISTKAGRVIKRKEVCDPNDKDVCFEIEDFFFFRRKEQRKGASS